MFNLMGTGCPVELCLQEFVLGWGNIAFLVPMTGSAMENAVEA